MMVLLFVSSFIMTSLGIIGEYLYRTLDATRNRPNFIIDETFGINNLGNDLEWFRYLFYLLKKCMIK